MTQQDIAALTNMFQSMQDEVSRQLLELKQDNVTRFEQIDKRFEQIEGKLAQHDARLFGIESRMATKEDLERFATKADFEQLKDTLDQILSHVVNNTDERVALSAQVTRHEDWIEKAAPVTGVAYTSGA